MRGAVLVNSGKRGKRGKKTVPLSKLFASVGGLKKNPLVANRRKKRAKKKGRKGRRRNPALSKRQMASLRAQLAPRNRKGQFTKYRKNKGRKGRKGRRRNPLVANPLIANRGRRKGRKGRRRNPLVANPLIANRGRRKGRKGRGRRRNPAILGKIAAPLRSIPIVGPIAATAIMALSGAAAGAIAVYPTHYALKYVSKWIPTQLKPFAFTLVGCIAAGVVKQFAPATIPYKNMLVGALASAGGAVDAYRRITGSSDSLAGEWGDEYGEWGDEYGGDLGGDLGDEMGGDLGDEMGGDLGDEYGDDEDVRPGEWADANGYDAIYSGEDLSDEELELAGLGRRAFRRRFRRRMRRARHANASYHAGTPGGRWGWLIYMIGFKNFRQLARMDRARRRQIIQSLRNDVMQRVTQAINTGVTGGDASMEAMEAAGLLAAA